jgi:flagellar hook-length control protein FliK
MLWDKAMTLSALDKPYSLIGSDSVAAEKFGKSAALGATSDVFATLLQTTGVQQVAYAGTSNEFDQTLDMQDETVSHEAKMGKDHQKYDGLGLEGGDAAAIETTRAPRKLEELSADDAGKRGQEGANQRAGTNGENNGADAGLFNIADGNELLALGLPVQESAVDVNRSANAAEAQRAAAAKALQSNGSPQQNANEALAAKGKETVTVEELPKSRYATSTPRPANEANNTNANSGVQVTKVQEDLVSQPASTLAASATLAAQTSKAEKPAVAAPIDLADELGSEPRLPLANAGRHNTHPQPTPPQAQPLPQPPSAGLVPPAQPAAPVLPPQPAVAGQQAQLAAATARPDTGAQTGQTLGDPLAGGPATSNASQASQRPQQAQAPQPPRPPVPPQEVTNQIAVQIKKAIGEGSDHIRIQLKPAELGRVEIKLEVSGDGRALAIVSAERADTLDLLQRDASGLRQALQDAGLSTDSNSLSFNLRGEGSRFEQEMAERGHTPRGNGGDTANTGEGEGNDAAEAALLAAQTAAFDGRINVQV